MRSKRLLLFGSLILIPIVLIGIFLLFFLNNEVKNGFKRNVVKKNLKVKGESQFDGLITGIAGIADNHVYFATSNPTRFLQMKIDLTDLKPIDVKYKSTQSLKDAYTVDIDSPQVRIYGGNLQTVISSAIGDMDSATTMKFEGTIFNQAVYLPSQSYIIRQYEPKVRDFVFVKYDKGGHLIKSEESLSNNIADDGISTQGILLYNHQYQSLIYVHRLMNRFYAFDTSLNLVFNNRTIDTFSLPNTIVKGYKEGNMNIKTFAAPPRFVNGVATTYGDHVYINSLLKADNDSKSEFTSKHIIDVYNVKGGNYQYSFYIPNFNEQKLTAIEVRRNTLIAVYGFGRHISSFELPHD